ncbi:MULTISPECIES: hypothetical protein [unclassified Streptomyces]|uniref:hypothetical protein n=1 Tax=unclassified Streptomyces TaxID=2593676 RepID=UPI002E18D4F4|nr:MULTISPECIES: hypothetical protein [unclassified Streptomyces]
MPDEQSRTDADSPSLSPVQKARIDFARRDLEFARAEDLGQIPAGGLILMIERLRTRLDDILRLVDETVSQDDGREDR